ncbi:Putative histone-fold, nascent polypeptide-associated complex subunit alpha [Septoria linicola]|uniref:Histone-fold, nascent polypeptide-associated complex subunit alpha n=1 Tax=Septoria linicola TaxID=215465 RepID=A0A9Q9AWP5_9PEZI|nr:Putative histone-fold, nascent polypeptide-associated complex subunit alpha [Septoria linicola]
MDDQQPLPPHIEPRAETPVSPLYSAFPLPSSRVSSIQLQRLSNRSDGDMTTIIPQSARSQAMSPSPSTGSSFSTTNSALQHQPATPTNVYPPPGYVSSFGATQVVSERKRHFSDDEDDDASTAAKPVREDMQFSTGSLLLLNGFLDQLLYGILLQARSTTLTALRPAVTEVLRSRLASEAIASAEEELSELLAGGEEEEDEMNHKQSVSERKRKWDTELVWKRTRLRVMVYIRLGEMEDDDEERYVREDELFQTGDRRFSHSTGLVSWAAAIFLTSVLEFVAEQLLQVAAQSAESRARRLSRNPRNTMLASDLVSPETLTVHDHDMEKCALHKTAGRLWRNWRKSLRSNTVTSPTPANYNSHTALQEASRRLSRDQVNGAAMSPRSSFGGPESVSALDESRPASRLVGDDRDASQDEATDELVYPEHVLAANIPLPMLSMSRDVHEIEVPGLARNTDAAEELFAAEQNLAAIITLPMMSEKRDVDEIETPGLSRDSDAIEKLLAAENRLAARTSLPMEGEKKDVDEIEVPGLARDPDASEELQSAESLVKRRSSWAGSMPVSTAVSKPDPPSEADREIGEVDVVHVPVMESPNTLEQLLPTRARSSSLPTLRTRPPPGLQQQPAQEVVPETQTEPTEEGETADAPLEQKANAAEMAAHKREIAAIDNQAAMYGTDNETSSKDHANQSIQRKAVPIALASTAAAAVGGAAIVGSQGRSDDAVETKERAMDQNDSQSVDERDAQKALKDMKRLSVPTGQNLKRRSMGQTGDDVGRTAKRMSLTQAVLVRSASSKDINSRPWMGDESIRQDTQTQAPAALQDVTAGQNGSEGVEQEQTPDIGVARTSDTAVSTPTKGDSEEGVYQARDSFTNPAPQRKSRIVLGDSPVSSASRDSPPLPQEDDDATSTLSPESFLKGRSLSAKRASQIQHLTPVESQSPNGQTRAAAPRSPIRVSAPDNLVIVNGPVSPISDRTPSPWRQSFSAAIKETTQWAPSSKKSSLVSEPSGPVQDHPALQKMASRSQTSLKEPESSQPLTSASIRGPEDFEMFVQGGDTVKYTLTPESVRGQPSPVEAVPYVKNSRSAEKLPSDVRKPPPIPVEVPRLGRSQSAKYATASDANAGVADEDSRSATSSKDIRRSISRPPVRNTSVHKKSGLMAREPQVVTESTRDFADFIRSTGPHKEPELRPLLSERSTTSLQALRDAHISGSRSQSPGPSRARSMSRSNIEAEDLPPVPAVVPPVPTNNRVRSNMQPREPVQISEDGTSELIDFIRSGPNTFDPNDKRQHRISRSVAPFRTTMDSDQMQEWGERYTPQPDLKINTNMTNAQAVQGAPSVRSAQSSHKSYRTSANSRSALLQNSASTTQDVAQPAYSDQTPRLTTVIPKSALQPFPTTSEPTITKTRVRNKDPYAIDFDDDDEDEDLLSALPKGRQREQESLIDFLRNSEPPEQNSPRHAFNGKTPVSPTSMRRGSGPSGLKTFGADAISFGRKGSMQSRDGPQPARSGPPSRSNGTTTIAVGPISEPRLNLEPRDRDADYTGPGGTRDLADFFRSSAPSSASNDPAPAPRMASRSNSNASIANSKASITSSQKRSRMSFLGGGMSSIFGRGSRKAYLDM